MGKTKKLREAEIAYGAAILEKRNSLLEPFLKKYNEPVLIHSTSKLEFFESILNSGKIKIPGKENMNKHSYIEKELGLYPSIFLSLGFQYYSCYGFKYSFIFSLDYLKELDFYKNSLSFKSYKAIAKYWDENSPEYMKKLSEKSKICKDVVDGFYNKIHNGKTREFFEYWVCEKEVFDLFQEYPDKKKVMGIIKKIVEDKYVRYPDSIKVSNEICLNNSAPEIICKKDIDLVSSPYFLGFFIEGKIPERVEKILREKYSGKIFFDGRKIGKIEE
jgi:hypothetical protein